MLGWSGPIVAHFEEVPSVLLFNIRGLVVCKCSRKERPNLVPIGLECYMLTGNFKSKLNYF